MFLAHSVEESKTKKGRLFQLYTWRVKLDATGRPIWTFHGKGFWARAYLDSEERCRQKGEPNVPFLQDAAPNKRVTLVQAQRLTGLVHGAAALDCLREKIEDHPDCELLENYVAPPKVKEPKPTPVAPPPPSKAQVARAKQAKAEAKRAEWLRKAVHATMKANEWLRKGNYQQRRAAVLERQEREAGD